MKKYLIAAAAMLLGLSVMSGAACAQQHTLTVSATTPAGAMAMMAGMSNMMANAGGAGANVLANVQAMTYNKSGFNFKSAFANASADTGMVLTGVSTKLGTTSAGANGSGVTSWSSGGVQTDATGKSQWLNSGASTVNGGAWTSVTTPNWNAVSVGAGQSIQMNTNYNSTPVGNGGGKG